jgi:hypothetical protein
LQIIISMWHLSRGFLIAGAVVVMGTATWVVVTSRPEPSELVEPPAESDASPEHKPLPKDKRIVTDSERRELLRRAQVWRRPQMPVSHARFHGANLTELDCKFKIDDLGGTTPKFDCLLQTGEEVRIKYGNGPEAPSETAASRLLRALGFGADDVTLVERLRCFGCPKEPFSVMKAVEITRAEPLYEHVVDYNSYEDFEWVALERKMNARPVETEKLAGWSFFELDTVQAEHGGAARAHLDGLRMMAVLLAHWDNKSENQRLVCLADEWPEDRPCPEPFLILQDVGGTFGPTKMDFDAWAKVRIWEDRELCSVSMRDLPFGGATFGQATITEPGRQFIGGLLSQLSDEQVTELFSSARFGEKRGVLAPTTPVAEWVRVFKQKVHAIIEGPACPED